MTTITTRAGKGSPLTKTEHDTNLNNLNDNKIDVDGSVALTSNWDAGSFKITAETFTSDVATGTAPFTVSSTTLVSNLNADTVDGIEGAAFLQKDGSVALTANWDVGSFDITAEQLHSDIATGTSPLTVASTTVVSNLNADTVDGVEAAAMGQLAVAATWTKTQILPTATLTDGANIDWDLEAEQQVIVTIAGNRTMNAPTNLGANIYVIAIVQDATGSRTMTWNALFKWAGGTAPTLTTTANAVDILTFASFGGSLLYEVSRVLDLG